MQYAVPLCAGVLTLTGFSPSLKEILHRFDKKQILQILFFHFRGADSYVVST